MIDFSKSIKLSGEEILERVTQKDIYENYLNSSIKEEKLYKCCFHEDNTPSLGFKTMESGMMIYNCFACGAKGGVFKFVGDLHHQDNYFETLRIIQNDLNLINIPKTFDSKKVIHNNLRQKSCDIIPTFKPFCKTDYDFWSSYYIPLDLCLRYDVRACKYVYVNRKGFHNIWAYYSDKDPLYSYQIEDRYKLYRPFTSKKDKWRGNVDIYSIQGYSQLPKKGELLIITSSLKDVMVLTVMGYNAVAPSGETVNIPEEIIEELYSRFDNIVVFYDNDKSGLEYGKITSERIGSGNIWIPIDYKDSKDISDFCKIQSLEEGKILMKKLL